LHRPASPLLHDYKHAAPRKPKSSRALQWFAVGLGIPLLGLAMISAVGGRPGTPPDATPVLTAMPGAEVGVDELAAAPKVYADEPLVLAPQPEYQKLTLTIRKGDTLDQLFRKNQLDVGELVTIAGLDEASKRFRRIKPGDVFEITHDDGNIVSMYSALDLTSALEIDREESGFKAKIVDRPIEMRKRFAYGLIESSLFQSAADAGLSDKTIMNLAGIFAWDIDFVLDIRGGDNFYVEWEEVWQDGKLVTDGDIIAAEFNNDGRSYRAVRFVDDSGRADYYTPDGHSVRKAFIRAPVDFTRISSNFNPHRRHPILNTIRAHQGVDYAAPKGTPIKASGDGKVIFRGVKGGYGNAVILQHGGNITTLYGHMSRFATGVGVGARVRQGQTIGYVGSTGLATANHLHYEYRINGVHRNPRTVPLPQADPIPAKYRDRFFATSEPIFAELDHFKSTQLASVTYAGQASR
jgi:murein DD-endopeptidase MepM/ murein hydrolase activator NlpD